MAGLSIPLLHIVDPTGEAMRAKGITKVGLLGTKPVMGSSYLRSRYADRFGIETLVPQRSRAGPSSIESFSMSWCIGHSSPKRSRRIWTSSITCRPAVRRA